MQVRGVEHRQEGQEQDQGRDKGDSGGDTLCLRLNELYVGRRRQLPGRWLPWRSRGSAYSRARAFGGSGAMAALDQNEHEDDIRGLR